MRRIASVMLMLALGRPAGAGELKIDWFALDLDLGGGVAGPDVEGVSGEGRRPARSADAHQPMA